MSGDERIGDYRLVKVLARGPMGNFLYLGFDEKLRRQVEIKVFPRLAGPKDVDAFLAGTTSFAKFDHPHIVPIYEIGRTEEGKHFIVSKFIEGHTLRKRIRDDPPSHEESIALVATIAETLHYMHQHGVIHGNVTPRQVLLENNTGNLFVLGSELANRVGDIEKGVIVGVPAYMSPEQVRGEVHLLDGRTDVFTAGVVLYELLTGTRPFRSSSRMDLIQEIISTDPVPPRKVNRAVPVEVDRICLKALAKQPSDRYSTAAELAHELLKQQTRSNWWWLSWFRGR